MDKCVNYLFIFFFFNDTATTEIYTLSLHDALPIYSLYTAKEGLNKGAMFKKEYIPYKNYIYKVVVKGEKDELLLKIQELTFKMIDLNLYLDLNKDNTEIFNELKSTITELNKNKELYAKNYGPLCLKDNVNYNSYMWSKNPWPWMNTGGNYNV